MRVEVGQVDVRLSGRDNDNVVRVVVQEADPAIADADLRWSDVSTTVLIRTGTTSAAVHEGSVTVGTAALRRIIVEDGESLAIDVGGCGHTLDRRRRHLTTHKGSENSSSTLASNLGDQPVYILLGKATPDNAGIGTDAPSSGQFGALITYRSP